MQRRRNLENSVVPTLLVRGSRLAFRATMYRADGDLEVCWNRILTIFDPYTFSHSQGQVQTPKSSEQASCSGLFLLQKRTQCVTGQTERRQLPRPSRYQRFGL